LLSFGATMASRLRGMTSATPRPMAIGWTPPASRVALRLCFLAGRVTPPSRRSP
jgi:hypothetical protein